MTDDKMAQLLDDASEKVREALHAASSPPEFPSDLYSRCSGLVELLGRLTQVATSLHDTTERAPQRFDLGSDDATNAGEHVDAACAALVRSAAEVDDAYRLANAAFSALSHLKLESP
jgi:hypothetical protein